MSKLPNDESVESAIEYYVTKELVSDPSLLPLKGDTRLLESKVLDSLSLLKLVLFLEQKFGVTIGPEELVPENFETIDVISKFLRAKKEA